MENEAFNKIYENYAKQVYHFLLNLSGNHDIAEELTQETFVKAYLNLDNFRGECRLNVWLCQIGKNLYFNYIKKEARYVPISEIIHMPSDGKSVEDMVLSTDSVKEFMHAISELPEPYQSVFVYHIFSQMSYSEIGAMLLKTDTWVRVTYYRAKKKLQSILKEEMRYEV
ncbi:MAG: RNA polymerase sigma factor [Eubacteriales bacterium]|nr:RNA polymerase sigma factor [Eubacteriales bacterium]